MKKWFNKLEDNHKLFLIIGLYVGTFLFTLLSAVAEFLSLFCVACLAFAIIFTVFYVQYKKSNTRQETPDKNITETKTVPNNTYHQEAKPVKKIEADIAFPKIVDGYFLRWHYKEDIALPQNIDKVALNDSDIELVPEPDNQYDTNAVALYKGGYKLGYFFKGQTREMILSYLDHKNYLIKTVVCLLDQESNKLAVRIAFYRDLESVQLDALTVPLVKITKRVGDLGRSRYENFDFKEVGDIVEISDNYDGTYTVCDEYGYELGELHANISEKMEEIFDSIIYAKIASIELTENDAYKVKISIFHR